jgi:ABC-2 type transport system ATP-binding protein
LPTIDAYALTKTYPGDIHALRGVGFQVDEGQVFALLGPNGAGKSTTVRILTTLSSADSGTARVAGHDVAVEPREVRRRIGYVAQESGVDVLATGRENLLLQGRIFRLGGGALHRRVDELLQMLDLADAAERLVRTYSGGMKRRLDVAMGLVHRPAVLFLDEPTTGLDPESRRVMWKEIARLAAEGITVLLTTHYLEEADRLADRLAIVDHGRVVAEGKPDELKDRLRGDVVAVTPRRPEEGERAREIVATVDGVDTVVLDEGVVYATVTGGTRRIPSLVAALEREGVGVEEIVSSRPSLDDVYLHLTGHAYHAEGDSPEGKDGAPAGALPESGGRP